MWNWTQNREQAAQLVADGTATEAEIAVAVGVAERTVRYWKANPEFQSGVVRHRDAIEFAIMREGIARKAMRIRRYADRLERLDRVIDARGIDMSGTDHDGLPVIPGGESGLIVRQIKSIGVGQHNREVEEFAVDTGLLREIRELEKQVAQELGQWVDKGELTGRDGGAIEIDDVGLSDDERIERLSSLLERARSRRDGLPAQNG